MAESTYYLAIDLGAVRGRVILGTLESEWLQLEEVHHFVTGPVRTRDGMHWDILRLWSEI